MNKIVKQENEIQELNNYSPNSLISQALAQGAGIDTLERLMALQERYESNQAKKLFLAAFAKFQSEVPNIRKTKKVSFNTTNYNYSTLSNIIKTIQKALENNGFSYRWEFEENGKIKCRCILSHLDGHSESSSMEAEKDSSGNKNAIQAIGSARTYLQRYTLIGVLGLTTSEDDNDGETAGSKKKETIPAPESIQEPKEKVNWTPLIKACQTKKEISSLWKRLSPAEQEEHKKTFSEVKSFIEDSNKKEK